MTARLRPDIRVSITAQVASVANFSSNRRTWHPVWHVDPGGPHYDADLQGQAVIVGSRIIAGPADQMAGYLVQLTPDAVDYETVTLVVEGDIPVQINQVVTAGDILAVGGGRAFPFTGASTTIPIGRALEDSNNPLIGTDLVMCRLDPTLWRPAP